MSAEPRPSMGTGWFALACLFLVGTAMDVACRYHPANLPYVMPWEFSWPVFLVVFVTLGWFWLGLRRLSANERPSRWRIAGFLTGLLADYAILQTHVDYLAQHMFFIHRAAHFVLLYPAPLLIALSAPGQVVRAGMPDYLKSLNDTPALRRAFDFMRRSMTAPLFFVGLIYFWLIPQIHARAMLDSNVHDAMDWSVAISAITFWSAMLDQRPKPPASTSFYARLTLILLVLLPQVALGAALFWSTTDVYPIYAICGRIFSMTALDDQHFGGIIIALPSTVMCIVAIGLVLAAMRRSRIADVPTSNSV